MLQALPLEVKVRKTELRIQEWVNEYGTDGVYVCFSGGKDSTVLLHIVRNLYPNIEAVFVNTGLEYPEIQQFVKTFDNVTILQPEMRFDEVLKTYGYPIISKEVSNTVSAARKNKAGGKNTSRLKKLNGELLDKNGNPSIYNIAKYKPLLDTRFEISDKCCDIMKKRPMRQYEKQTGKKPMLAQMASESRKRTDGWLKSGCNGFNMKHPQSNPMAFWMEDDVLQYIKQNNVPIASVYGEILYDGEKLYTTGCNRTGCIFCAYGCHLDKEPSRFQRLENTHPRQYEYCIRGGEYNENGIWKPNEQGLGMGHIFNELNKLYGEEFIKY